MKIKVCLVDRYKEPDKSYIISESEEVTFIADCPTEVHLERSDYPRQEFVIQISE